MLTGAGKLHFHDTVPDSPKKRKHCKQQGQETWDGNRSKAGSSVFFFVSVASAKCSFATASCIQVNSRYGTMGFWGFATAVFQESDAICWCSTRVFPKNLDYCRGVWSMLWFRLTMNLKKQRHPKNQAFVRRFAARFEIKDTKINEMSRQKMEVATVASWLLIRTCSNWESVYPMDPNHAGKWP